MTDTALIAAELTAGAATNDTVMTTLLANAVYCDRDTAPPLPAASNIEPDATGKDGAPNGAVRVTLTEFGVAEPILRPLIVTATIAKALMLAPDVVSTMASLPVASR